MSKPDSTVALRTARTLREDAWALVRADVALLRNGLEARPIAQRIKEQAIDEMVDVVDTARDVASENKAVVGLTLAALVGWLLRGPIADLIKRWQ
jgi:hypothetical protein